MSLVCHFVTLSGSTYSLDTDGVLRVGRVLEGHRCGQDEVLTTCAYDGLTANGGAVFQGWNAATEKWRTITTSPIDTKKVSLWDVASKNDALVASQAKFEAARIAAKVAASSL